jgi:RNA polymerase sporulation-specific sigma factor
LKTFLSPLTMEQESECLKKMKNGDLEARNELIERNMRLVAHVAKKYQSQEDEMEDLISIGTIGLIKAVETYKEDYGSRLATYAARCIDNELLMHFRAKKKTSKEVSLYEPIGTDKEGNQIQLLDVVVSEDEDVVELLEQDRKVRRLNEIIPQTLSGRELFIIINRYGLYGKKTMTQREIARKLGISRSYVSRIEKRAIEKLRQAF